MKIEDYALIGDCQTAALVGRNGSIRLVNSAMNLCEGTRPAKQRAEKQAA